MFSNNIGDISIPSIVLSLGIGMSTNFKMVGNRSMVAASYIETYTHVSHNTIYTVSVLMIRTEIV